eukprot:g2268.t1
MEETFGEDNKKFYEAWKKQRLVPEDGREIAGEAPDDQAQRFPSCTKEQTDSLLKTDDNNVQPSRAFFPKGTKTGNGGGPRPHAMGIPVQIKETRKLQDAQTQFCELMEELQLRYSYAKKVEKSLEDEAEGGHDVGQKQLKSLKIAAVKDAESHKVEPPSPFDKFTAKKQDSDDAVLYQFLCGEDKRAGDQLIATYKEVVKNYLLPGRSDYTNAYKYTYNRQKVTVPRITKDGHGTENLDYTFNGEQNGESTENEFGEDGESSKDRKYLVQELFGAFTRGFVREELKKKSTAAA